MEYGPAQPFAAEVWPAGGKLQAEMYGQRLNCILNARVEGNYQTALDEKGRVVYQFSGMELQEGSGVCVYVDGGENPDYQVLTIKPYHPLYLEMERL